MLNVAIRQMTFLIIHQLIVRMNATAMLYLLYRALQSLLSRGMIPIMHRSSISIYGDMIYMYGLK